MERKHHFRNLWKRKSIKEISATPSYTGSDQTPIRRPKSLGFISLFGPPSKGDFFGTASRVQTANVRPRPSPDPRLDHAQSCHDSRQHTLISFDRPVLVPTAPIARPNTAPTSHAPTLYLGKMDTNLSEDLRHITLGGDDRYMTEPSRKRYSEDVAERNIPGRVRAIDILDHALPGYPRVSVERSQYSEDVAERNLSTSATSHRTGASGRRQSDIGIQTSPSLLAQLRGKNLLSSHVSAFPATGTHRPLRMHPPLPRTPSFSDEESHPKIVYVVPEKTLGADVDFAPYTSDDENSQPDELRGRPLRRKQRLSPLKGAKEIDPETNERFGSPVSSLALTNEDRPESTIKKPLAPTPSESSNADEMLFQKQSSDRDVSRIEPADESVKESLAQTGIDVRNTTDTEFHTKWAPAVIQETIRPVVCEIREEEIKREIHNHDVYHRILPIKDIEILPARHFIHTRDGQFNEVPAESVPGVTGSNQNWQIVETVSKDADMPLVPRKFTARTFEGTEDDYKEYVGEDGVKRSRKTWVHPPNVETGAKETGQSESLYLNEVTKTGGGMPGGWDDW